MTLATTERILTTTSGSMPLPLGMERLGELLYAGQPASMLIRASSLRWRTRRSTKR